MASPSSIKVPIKSLLVMQPPQMILCLVFPQTIPNPSNSLPLLSPVIPCNGN